ncbi:MAG TPA: hypothetical protein EYN67_14740 [Flavobacteriales bacterium]|nr:hypothetical protein [Flavobacteriales bacterium]
MAIRKNKKRIDPRYFLHETTNRDEIEEEVTDYQRRLGYTDPEQLPGPEHAAPGAAEVDPNTDFPTVWARILDMINAANANEQMGMLRRIEEDLKYLVRK